MAGSAVQGPTKSRFLKSYEVRRAFKDAIQYPPEVPGVKDAIDIHCHADQGHQDGLAVAKHATRSGMGGILFKSIAGEKSGAETVKDLQESLLRWAEEEKLELIRCRAGYVVRGSKGPSLKATREQHNAGAVKVWMPVAMHANTLSKVGGRKIWWDKTASRQELTPPLPWEEALKVGPFKMYEAIRAVGVEQVMLSSDVGEPLFPNSVEAMRLIRAYMRAYGLDDEEIHRVSVANPAKIIGTA